MSVNNFEYLIVLALCLAGPIIVILSMKTKFKAIAPIIITTLITAPLWILSDVYQTSLDHWSFSPDYTTGTKLAGLPVEELFFFFVVPFSTLFLWIFFKPKHSNNA